MDRHLKNPRKHAPGTMKMEDGLRQRKRAKMEIGPVSPCQQPGQLSDPHHVLQCNGKKGQDYLTLVSDQVSKNRHETFDLKSPAGARWKIGDLDDTIYSGQDDELNSWGRNYLPKMVSMQVVGVVEWTSCPCDQLVLMTCEDRKLYAYDGEELHEVASSLVELQDKGLQYPASNRYYAGEALKSMPEEEWAKVRKQRAQEFDALVKSLQPAFLEKLKLISEKIGKPKNSFSQHANSTQTQVPKLGADSKPCCVL